MSAKPTLRGYALGLVALGLACLSLAACSNRQNADLTTTDMIKGTVTTIFKRDKPQTPDPNVIAQYAAQALANTSGQAIILAIPGRNVMTVMQEIERNGPYITFGSSDRRSVTMKGGIMTATRGLGNDLMSSDVSSVSRLIRSRQEGAARRVNRYLDGENVTTSLSPWCQTKLDQTAHISVGEINSMGTLVLESCLAEDLAFQNSYVVSPSGRILQSRQWVSPLNGYVTIHALR